MTLIDTGPLVAMIDAGDEHSQRVSAAINRIRSWPLATTEACVTEALYLLGKAAGYPGQAAFWRLVDDGSLIILSPTPLAPKRASDFMQKYRDLPCDYADATLLVAAEDTGIRCIFTIDPHFNAYRLASREAMEVFV